MQYGLKKDGKKKPECANKEAAAGCHSRVQGENGLEKMCNIL